MTLDEGSGERRFKLHSIRFFKNKIQVKSVLVHSLVNYFVKCEF